MATVNSSLLVLALTILGASLLGTCTANKELEASTTRRWSWGWGGGWSGGRGQDTPPAGTPRGQGWGWGWSGGRGQDTPPAGTPVGQGWGWSWSGGRGQHTPPAGTPWGQGWGWSGRRGQDTPPAGTPQGQGWGWSRGRGRERGQDAPPAETPQAQPGQSGWPATAGYNFSRSGSGWPFSHKNRTRGPNKIVVGGSNNWNFGFNYTDWALKSGPFYLNDVLVFKFNAPVNGAPGHSVYQLPDFKSYLKCDLRRAKRVATTNQGGGKGFEFKLTKWKPHYFACGEHNGIHCNLGMMKFFVMPIFRYEINN